MINKKRWGESDELVLNNCVVVIDVATRPPSHIFNNAWDLEGGVCHNTRSLQGAGGWWLDNKEDLWWWTFGMLGVGVIFQLPSLILWVQAALLWPQVIILIVIMTVFAYLHTLSVPSSQTHYPPTLGPWLEQDKCVYSLRKMLHFSLLSVA